MNSILTNTYLIENSSTDDNGCLHEIDLSNVRATDAHISMRIHRMRRLILSIHFADGDNTKNT